MTHHRRRPTPRRIWLSAGLLGLLAAGLTAIPVSAAGSTTYRDCSQITVAAGADLHRCDLADSTIIGLDLNGINVAWSDLSRVNGGCDPDLPRTNLNGAIAYRALFVDAKLCDAILTYADLHGSGPVGRCARGRVGEPREPLPGGPGWRRRAFAAFDDANLGNVSWRTALRTAPRSTAPTPSDRPPRDAVLSGASLVGTDLRYARLDGADLARRPDRCERGARRPGCRPATSWLPRLPGRHEQRQNTGATCVGH